MADNDWPRTDTPEPMLETMDERLTKLEVAVSSLTNPGARSEYAAHSLPVEALAPGALVQAVLPALAAKAVDEAGGAVGRLAIAREFQLMFRMYFDPRYRLSRVGQFTAPAVVLLMVLNYFFVSGMPVIGFLVERLVLVALAVVLYKVLAREAGRYAAVLQYLAQYGR